MFSFTIPLVALLRSSKPSIVLEPGEHTLRFEFEPTGQPDLQSGSGAPGKLQIYVDGTLAGNAEAPVTTPFVSTLVRSLAAPTLALPSATTTPLRSGSPARSPP